MDLRESIQNAISYLILKDPFLGILLKRTWIIARDDIPIASTDGLRIYINPERFKELDPKDQLFVLLHELGHIMLQHVPRIHAISKDPLDHAIANVIADAVVNERLFESGFDTRLNVVTCEEIPGFFFTIGSDECKRSSFEDLFAKVLNDLDRNLKRKEYKAEIIREKVMSREHNIGEDLGGEGGEKGEILNEGDQEDKDAHDSDSIKSRSFRKVMETYSFSGIRPGKRSLGIARIVDEILEPKISWKHFLRKNLIGSNVKRSWSRPSRKHPLYPGKVFVRRSRTVVLVDTSGSILDEDLREFLGEIYGILREKSEIIVIPWDTKPYEPIEVKRLEDIKKVKTGMKGGGGTMILPVLKLVDKKYRNVDNIVILSDWEIYDIRSDEVIEILKKYKNKIIAVTIGSSPPEFLRSVKLR